MRRIFLISRVGRRSFQTAIPNNLFSTTGIPSNCNFLPAALMDEASALPDVQESDRLVSLGKFSEATAYLNRARDIFSSMSSLPIVLPLQVRRAKLLQYQGKFDQELNARQEFLQLLSSSFSQTDAPQAFIFGVSSLSLSMIRNKLFLEASGLCDFHYEEFASKNCPLGMVYCDIINALSMASITNAPVAGVLLSRASANCCKIQEQQFERSASLISADILNLLGWLSQINGDMEASKNYFIKSLESQKLLMHQAGINAQYQHVVGTIKCKIYLMIYKQFMLGVLVSLFSLGEAEHLTEALKLVESKVMLSKF